MSTPRRVLAGMVLGCALLAPACAAPAEPEGGEATASVTPSATAPAGTPSPVATLVPPETGAGEIARVEYGRTAGEGGIPEQAQIVSGALEPGVRFRVEGECIGESVDFELIRAAVGDSGTVIVAGTMACAEPDVLTTFDYGVEWSGLAQLRLTSTDGVEQAWMVARQLS